MAVKAAVMGKVEEEFRIENLVKCLVQLGRLEGDKFISRLVLPYFNSYTLKYLVDLTHSKHS